MTAGDDIVGPRFEVSFGEDWRLAVARWRGASVLSLASKLLSLIASI